MASTDGAEWRAGEDGTAFVRTYLQELLLYLWYLAVGFGVTMVLAQVNPRFDIDLLTVVGGGPMGWIVFGTALVVLPGKAAFGRGVLRSETDVWQIVRTSIVYGLFVVVVLFGTHVAINAGDLIAGGRLAY